MRHVKPAHNHIVQFYEDDRYMAVVVARFLAEGLRAGHSLIVIVTPEHRHMISNELRREGIVPEAAIVAGQLTICDARNTLGTFMTGNNPDPVKFNSSIGGLIEQVRRRRPGLAIRAFGEMVDVLCRESNPRAAKELEVLWNRIAATERFALLCAYHIRNFGQESQSHRFQSICDEHAFVLPTETYMDIDDEEKRLREISRLQQRAESLESALAESREANRLKDEFLATVSHELRTPLSAILGWNHLAETTSDPKIVRRAFEVINRNAQMQLHLVEDLLDVSRMITGKLDIKSEPVDLIDLVSAAVNSVQAAATAKGIIIDVNINPAVPSIAGDIRRLHQVLWNILSNAVKFTPSRGRIEVRAERVHSHVQIMVRDTGVGIAREFLPHVFERFRQADTATTRENGGLGLGLAIVRHLVEAHGGTVHVESPGKDLGTTFAVCLPVESAASMAS
jgi:signal transduction histidine kinase